MQIASETEHGESAVVAYNTTLDYLGKS